MTAHFLFPSLVFSPTSLFLISPAFAHYARRVHEKYVNDEKIIRINFVIVLSNYYYAGLMRNVKAFTCNYKAGRTRVRE